ncbi:MAG: hydrogen peroxide-inducible genes activator [Pseudomonadota bacterium]
MQVTNLTFKQLRYLVAVDDLKHFRKAAEACHVSQPSLSVQIQNVEDVLGVQLVERGRSGVAFTPVGREVVERARRVLDEVQGLFDYASSSQRGMAGTIRLGAKPTLGPYLMPYVVRNLHQSYPDLNLYVREASPRELEQELRRGVHDVILAQLPVYGSSLVTHRLFREPLYVAVALDHPLAREPEIDPEDLSGADVLSLNPQYHLHEQISHLCNDFDARLLRDYEGTSLDALRQMVGMGMGITFLPALYVQSEIRDGGDVVVKKLKNKPIFRSMGLVWRESAGNTAAFLQIANIIQEVARERFQDLFVEG